MDDVIITSDQARDARTKLGISQGKVAASAGLNRAYLSLFENGKFLLSDPDRQKLRSYYTDMGIEFDDRDKSDFEDFDESGSAADQVEQRGGVRVMDGFAIPSAADTEEIDSLLAEYATNREMISNLCQYDIRKHHSKESFLFLGDPEIDAAEVEKRTKEVLVLMARNYSLVERLQGHMA